MSVPAVIGGSLYEVLREAPSAETVGAGPIAVAGVVAFVSGLAAIHALLTLVGTQLGQTLWLGWRNPAVAGAVLGSGAVLLAIVQTPGLSRLVGSRPLGPLALAHAAACVAGGVIAAGVAPAPNSQFN